MDLNLINGISSARLGSSVHLHGRLLLITFSQTVVECSYLGAIITLTNTILI